MAGSAVTTLEAVVVNERFLYLIEGLAGGDALDGQDIAIPSIDTARVKAANYQFTGHGDGACPAQPVIAALLRPSQPEMFSQNNQRSSLDVGAHLIRRPVDPQCNLVLDGGVSSLLLQWAANPVPSNASRVMGRSRSRRPVAWKIAFAIAAGAPQAPISPIPRTPRGSRS